MKRIIWAIILIALVATAIFFLEERDKSILKNENDSIKIGVILPLTGDLAFLGEEIKKGIDLAVSEYKDRGIDINVIYEDDQSLSSVIAVSAANKLLNIDKIDAGLTVFIEESRSISPIFNKEKVPLLVLWDSNNFILESGDYVFSNGFSTELAGESMADFAYNKLGVRSVAIIGHIDPWANIITKSFKNKLEIMGAKVAYNEQFNIDTKDYRTAIIQIKKLNPDAVYFPMLPMNSVQFLAQAKQLGLKSIFLTGDSFISDAINKAGSASEGVYFTNIYTISENGLFERYNKFYKSSPIDITLVSFGYDGIIKTAGSGNRSSKKIKENLESAFGDKRSASRVEKIFKVQEGIPVEVKDN